MKAIIMAAGIGSRIRSVIGNKPKCLIEANGETLIGRMVRILNSRNIHDITVITGFESKLIHDELGVQVKYLHNPFYAVTNSISSLWLAKNLLDSHVILMNADLYIEENIIDTALVQTRHVVMLSDSSRIEDADFRFGVEGDRIVKTGNTLENHETDCEYVGIVRIDKSFIAKFKTRLEYMIQHADFKNWWEGVLYSFIDDGMPVYHEDIIGSFWTEVDHLADYQRLNGWLAKQKAPFVVSGEANLLAG